MRPRLTRKEKKIIKNLRESLFLMSGAMNRELFKRVGKSLPMTDEEMAQMSRTEYLTALTLFRLKRFEESRRGEKDDARPKI